MTAPLSDETLREMRKHLEEAKAAHHTLTEKPTRVGVRVFMALGHVIRAFPRLLDEVERLQREAESAPWKASYVAAMAEVATLRQVARDNRQWGEAAIARAVAAEVERDALREALSEADLLLLAMKHDVTYFPAPGIERLHDRIHALLLPTRKD